MSKKEKYDPRIFDPDYPNPIVEEIRAIKHKLAAECDNDLDKIFADLKRKEEASGRKYVSCPPRSGDAPVIPPLDTTSDNTPTQQPAE